jgi:hypothetical protein
MLCDIGLDPMEIGLIIVIEPILSCYLDILRDTSEELLWETTFFHLIFNPNIDLEELEVL